MCGKVADQVVLQKLYIDNGLVLFYASAPTTTQRESFNSPASLGLDKNTYMSAQKLAARTLGAEIVPSGAGVPARK